MTPLPSAAPLPPGCPWSGWAPPNVQWCEENLCALVTAPANTWSNLAYIVVGLVMWAAARRLGEQMADRGIRLVYGGDRIGLMGVVADAVLAGGGEVIGIIPEFLKDLEVGNDAVTEQIVTGSMHARKTRMFELADGFVVLPGGLGTLDETLEIIAWKQLQLHAKPVVVLNTD